MNELFVLTIFSQRVDEDDRQKRYLVLNEQEVYTSENTAFAKFKEYYEKYFEGDEFSNEVTYSQYRVKGFKLNKEPNTDTITSVSKVKEGFAKIERDDEEFILTLKRFDISEQN
jgi:hypothetical protein